MPTLVYWIRKLILNLYSSLKSGHWEVTKMAKPSRRVAINILCCVVIVIIMIKSKRHIIIKFSGQFFRWGYARGIDRRCHFMFCLWRWFTITVPDSALLWIHIPVIVRRHVCFYVTVTVKFYIPVCVALDVWVIIIRSLLQGCICTCTWADIRQIRS